MKWMKIVLVGFCLTLSTQAFAEQNQSSLTPDVTLNLGDLDSETAQRVLSQLKRKQQENAASAARAAGLPAVEKLANPETVSKYKELAQAISQTILEVCKTLNVEVNEFVKTPVGKITMTLIVWKVAGREVLTYLLRYGVGIPIFIFLYCALFWSFRAFHMTRVYKKRRWPWSNLPDTEPLVVAYKWDNNKEAKTASAIVHVAIFVLLTITALSILIP